MPKTAFWFKLAVGVVGLLGAWRASAVTTFTDPSKTNVLRQFNWNGTQLVSVTNDTSFDRPYSNDGSGQIAYDSTFAAGSGDAQQTFTLPAPVQIGSYRVQFESNSYTASNFVILGRLGGSGAWTTLKTLTGSPLTQEQAGNLDLNMLVDQVRYVASPPASSSQLFLSEMEVFPASAATVPLYGDRDSGVAATNLLRDTGRVTATLTSATGVVAGWRAPPAGNAATLIDGSYRMNEHVAFNYNTSEKVFCAYDFVGPTWLNMVFVGANRDQGTVNPIQIWTSNLANPDEYIDADWKLQASGKISGGMTNGALFQFMSPGYYQHLRLTLSGLGENVGLVEMEAYGVIPEPASLSLLALGGLALLRRRRK